jgi:hypothetical protein
MTTQVAAARVLIFVWILTSSLASQAAGDGSKAVHKNFLRKHKQPVGLKASLRESVSARAKK